MPAGNERNYSRMKTIRFATDNIPVIARVQVLVVGSGPAGVAAAVAASRTGAETMLAERYGCLGGALSVSMVQSYSFSVNRDPQVLSGIPLEIDQRVRAYGASQPDYRGSGVLIDPEMYKCMLDEWMDECGIRVILHSTACATLSDGNRIFGVVFHSKSGFFAIEADCIVDATGDGDIANQAGATFVKREKTDLQPVTTVFGVSGVDMDAFQAHCKLHPSQDDPEYGLRKIFRQATENGEWKVGRLGGAWKSVTEQGDIISLNILMNRGIDPTDVLDLTFAENSGRTQVMQAIRLMRKYGADIGFGNCFLRTIAPQLGLRESRKIKGKYFLTEKDVVEQRQFPDSVGKFLCFMDPFGDIVRPENGQTFTIPYGMLLPQEIEGLLVAGRCVSCDEMSYGAMRMMVCCAVTGQAAGTAAALSAKNGVTPQTLDIQMLRKKLEDDGVRL